MSLRNKATPEQFAAMHKMLADWKAEVPAEMRTAAEAILALVDDLDPLVALGVVFLEQHLMPQLAGKEMSKSFGTTEHLALLIAKEDRTGANPAIGSDVAEDLLNSLAQLEQQSIQLHMPDPPAPGSGPTDRPFDDALATIVSWELAVRGERYDHQQKALIQALFSPFATELKATVGFTCDDAMTIEDAYTKRIESTALKGAEEAARYMDDVDRILRNEPALNQQIAAMAANILAADPGADLKMEVASMFPPWMALRSGYSIAPTLDELAAETGLQRDVVQSVLNKLSTIKSDLVDYWQMMPMSPLKTKPLVAIGQHFALPCPSLFLTALQTAFESALKGTAAWESYQKHRSTYGEDRAATLFSKALPGASIHRNMKYSHGGRPGEVDVLVVFDRQLFLVEVKSGDFADAARAGVENRVQDALRDLVTKAHEQVARAADAIELNTSVTFRNGTEQVDIRRGDFDSIHLMSVTVEQLGHVVNTAGAYIHAAAARTPWSVSLDDLEVICDILTRPPTFLHYIFRREALLPDSRIQNGDELGFLEAYLHNSLRQGSEAFTGLDNVMMDASSKTIDAYENAKGAGGVGIPPSHKVPDEINTLLDKLMDARPAGWIAASLTLLDLIPRQQRLLIRNMTAFAHKGKKSKMVVTGSGDGATARFRLDDPRLPGDSGGPTLTMNRGLDLVDLLVPNAGT